jgi:hypothetical protein
MGARTDSREWPFLCPHAGWLSLKFLRWLATRNLIVAMQTGSDTTRRRLEGSLVAMNLNMPATPALPASWSIRPSMFYTVEKYMRNSQ